MESGNRALERKVSQGLSPLLTLNSGQSIPQLGLGVYKLGNDIAADLLHAAFAAGYRRIDTAAFYGNEQAVGVAIRASSLPREEIFVTTKIWNEDHGLARAAEAIDESLARLELDYLDMVMIHWPKPHLNLFVETWQALEKAVASGKVLGIGVSNFQPTHLKQIIDSSGTVPAINQVELNPGFQQAELRKFNSGLGIATEAWSPIARGVFNENPIIAELAKKHSKSPSQIIIRWHLDIGNLVIPKTATKSRLHENISVFDFKLDQEDLAAISTLETGIRTGLNPDEF
ncbi:MAG: aldo/keto reductase [Actinobacteria bacterium]|jgi:2,5-diketo-D-gluconate reductase A|nr:aldo/keto reductase [Actinomycetota bacterium]